MAARTLDSALALLREGQLLRPEDACALKALSSHIGSPSELVRVVLKRGWLTPYQARELFAGRGQELLFGGYVVLEQLGEGSTARVFKARHRLSGRVVALKVLRPDSLLEAGRERLRREHWAGTRLGHPNILRTYGSGRAAGAYFLVMEYVEGKSLARLVREQGPLPAGRASDYGRQTALGLQHALERGLIHRDVKPSNLLLAVGTGAVKILDLGIARVAGAIPVHGSLASGTPDYVAPEQVSDPERADTRADVYALGCTLYHLLTGRPPFPGGSREAKLLRHRQEEPPLVEALRPELPHGLGEVVRAMTAKSPADRFPTPAAVAAALAPFAEAGDSDPHWVLELDEGGLAELDPDQATVVLAPAPPRPSV